MILSSNKTQRSRYLLPVSAAYSGWTVVDKGQYEPRTYKCLPQILEILFYKISFSYQSQSVDLLRSVGSSYLQQKHSPQNKKKKKKDIS